MRNEVYDSLTPEEKLAFRNIAHGVQDWHPTLNRIGLTSLSYASDKQEVTELGWKVLGEADRDEDEDVVHLKEQIADLVKVLKLPEVQEQLSEILEAYDEADGECQFCHALSDEPHNVECQMLTIRALIDGGYDNYRRPAVA